MKKIIFFTFFIFSFFFISPRVIYSDGLLVKVDPYAARWDFSDEVRQNAFITYEEGNQEMLISVEYEEDEGEGMIWLFPVPSDPNDITVDILKSVPDFRGEEISLTAEKNLDEVYRKISLTQFYPSFLNFISGSVSTSDSGPAPFSRGLEETSAIWQPDVVVYEHIEKEGITTEVITARTAEGLFDYLDNKGLDLDENSIPVLSNYIGEDYSFVVSWLTKEKYVFGSSDMARTSTYFEGYFENDYGENVQGENEKGVLISFPTEDLYFPLMPTSVYGNKVIPASIRIGNYVTPRLPKEIEEYSTVQYYVLDREDNLAKDSDVFNWVDDSMRYTKIDIEAPSNLFVQDLWMERKAPFKAEYTTFIVKNSWFVAISVFLISSLVTGLFVGSLLFKNLRNDFKKLVLLSLSNCFTLVGLIIATIFINTKDTQESPQVSVILKQLRDKGYVVRRRVATVLMIIFAFPILIGFLGLLFFEINIFTAIFLLIFGLILLLRKVKDNDKELFKALELEGYSTYTFLPKDQNKIVFPILYSPLFLMICFLLIRLIIRSVR